MNLSDAQVERRLRGELLLDQRIQSVVDELYTHLAASNASPADRKKLSGLIKHYMKMKHPFTACVRDNTKRFGKERAEKVCATLKDIGTGTKNWRKGGRGNHALLSTDVLVEVTAVDDELSETIYALSQLDLPKILDLTQEDK